jgi:hypothetical protein
MTSQQNAFSGHPTKYPTFIAEEPHAQQVISSPASLPIPSLTAIFSQ